MTADFGLQLPWPKQETSVPKNVDGKDVAEESVLIWGGNPSVGQYALQVLRWYGYKSLLATASKRTTRYSKSTALPAPLTKTILSSRRRSWRQQATKASSTYSIAFGSQFGSLAPIAKIAENGTRVAVVPPVIVRDASETKARGYAMDVQAAADWRQGVKVRGVGTHFYQNNLFFKEHLQPTVMPQNVGDGLCEA